MAELKLLIVHYTATPEGREVTADEIRKWHMGPKPQGRGWSRVGYSDMIHLNGTIENLHPYNEDDIVEGWELTNGAKGMNQLARHVVYVGGTDADGKAKDTRTEEQMCSMEGYILDFAGKHPAAQVAGHYHFANKPCPGFDVEDYCRKIGVPENQIYTNGVS